MSLINFNQHVAFSVAVESYAVILQFCLTRLRDEVRDAVGAAIAAVVFLVVVYPVGIVRARVRGAAFEPPLVPFGVFLAPAAFVTLVWGRDLIDWYLSRMMG